MKRLAKPVAYILLVLAVLLLATMLWGSHIIRFSINTAAPRILGVPASVERVVFRPFRGHMTIAHLL